MYISYSQGVPGTVTKYSPQGDLLRPIHINSIEEATVQAVPSLQAVPQAVPQAVAGLEDVADLEAVAEGAERHITALRFSPDHSKLLATSASPQLHQFNLQSVQQAPPMMTGKNCRPQATHVVFSNDRGCSSATCCVQEMTFTPLTTAMIELNSRVLIVCYKKDSLKPAECGKALLAASAGVLRAATRRMHWGNEPHKQLQRTVRLPSSA